MVLFSKLSCLEHLNIGACEENCVADVAGIQLETALNDCRNFCDYYCFSH